MSIIPVILSGGECDSWLESVVCEAKRSAVIATIRRLANLAPVGTPIVATNDIPLLHLATSEGAEVIRTDTNFHFGRILAAVANRHPGENILYVGGGSAALMSVTDWRAFVSLLGDSAGIVPNNLYSADFVLFGPASVINAINPPTIDNDLAFRLVQAGLPARIPDQTAANQFDIDTVVDAVTATFHPNCPADIRRLMQRNNFDIQAIESIKSIVIDPEKELLVSGRIGAAVWRVMEKETACRKRVLSEERGMRANGRQDAGMARSILGILMEKCGPAVLVEQLMELSDGAIIDSRVLMAHMNWQPSSEDRMASDLLAVERIQHQELRAFTQEIRRSSWPVLMSGHNLISAGLWTLAENAWIDGDTAQSDSAVRG